MTVLIPILGLLFLIFIHELGHFVVAKSVGMKATKFYIGFPPAILRRKRGETEYGVGAIPLGGYVRIVGMNRPQPNDLWRVNDAVEEAEPHRGEHDADALGHAVDTLRRRLSAPDLAGVAPAARATIDALETDRDLLDERTYHDARRDLTRLEEDSDDRAYWRLSVSRRIATIAAGPGANLLAAIVILAVYFWSGIPVFDVSSRIDSVNAGSPAATAGLRADDSVVAVNGQPVKADGVSDAIQKADGNPITLTVERSGERVNLRPVTAERQDGGRWLLGFQLAPVKVGTESRGPIQAVGKSFTTVADVTRATFGAIKDIFISSKGRDQLTTPVGIVSQSESTVHEGSFPGVLALISLSLAIFNMLPFLPLDGGHILFALIEKARGGRPVSRFVFERVSVVGIGVMMLLFLIGITNDIGRLSSP